MHLDTDMSGHSKWSTIKRQKGANDKKRGQIFTKLSKAISLAVRNGGGSADPAMNFKLRLAVEAARAVNMPKDNIERAIERASGKQAEIVEEMLYEGFGPGGFSVIVEAITDNKQRTTPEIKSMFDKNGGTLGNPGSVSYQYVQKGMITVQKGSQSLDEVFLLAADAGAEDVEDAGDRLVIYTKPEEVSSVKEALGQAGIEVEEYEITRKPIVTMAIETKEDAERALAFMEKLEEHDDVQKVYANFDIPDTVMGN